MFVDHLRAFFEAERQRPRWRGLLVVTVVALVPFVGGLVLVTLTPTGDQPAVALATRSGVVETPAFTLSGVIISFVTPFVFWLLYTAIAHGITANFGGEGSYTRYATLFAWGFLPGLLVETLWMGVLIANVTETAPPEGPTGTAAWIESVQAGPAMTAVEVLYPPALLVSFVLWTVATEVGRRVTTRQAALAAMPALLVELAAYVVFVLR